MSTVQDVEQGVKVPQAEGLMCQVSEAQTCMALLRSISSSVWMAWPWRRKVIRNEPEKVNWEQMIKVIISSVGRETLGLCKATKAVKQPGKLGVFKFRSLETI